MRVKFFDGTEKEIEICPGANLSGANLRGADLYEANLGGANLDGANLRGANLRGANLVYCTGDGSRIQSIHMRPYSVVVCGEDVCIGCTCRKYSEWVERINLGEFDSQLVSKYKPLIDALIEANKNS